MVYTDKTRVKDVDADMTRDEFIGVLAERRSPVTPFAAGKVYDYAVERRVLPSFVLGIFAEESSFGTDADAIAVGGGGAAVATHSWGNTTEPSYGAAGTGDAPVRGRFTVYKDWIDGGVSTIARLVDNKAYDGKDTPRAIIQTWAPSSDGNRTEEYIAGVVATMNRMGGGTVPDAKPAPRIAVASGHHNTSGGDQYEYAQTGELAEAVARHCRALGMDVRVVQPDGPDADTEPGDGTIAGSLDVVGNTVVAWAKAGWVADIFIECHTEGGGEPRGGVFAIYPDWGTDVDADVRDVLGPALAKAVQQKLGGNLGAGGDGVMSEQQTGVGASGFRLGIFRTTAPLAAATTRLICEYYAHDRAADKAIRERPDFADLCGLATAEAFADFLGWHATTPPTPQPGGDESARLMAEYRALPGYLRGSEAADVFYECGLDFAGVEGAPVPQGQGLRSEYCVIWTWAGQPIRALQWDTFRDMEARGDVTVYA